MMPVIMVPAFIEIESQVERTIGRRRAISGRIAISWIGRLRRVVNASTKPEKREAHREFRAQRLADERRHGNDSVPFSYKRSSMPIYAMTSLIALGCQMGAGSAIACVAGFGLP